MPILTELTEALSRNGFQDTSLFHIPDPTEKGIPRSRWFEKMGALELSVEIAEDEVRIYYYDFMISEEKLSLMNKKKICSLISFFLLPVDMRKVIIRRGKSIFGLYQDLEMVKQIEALQKQNEGIQLMNAFRSVDI